MVHRNFAMPSKLYSWAIAAFGLAILAGLAVRVCGLYGDLWLDEIWAITRAKSLTRPWQVFASTEVDGHSSLITIYMWLLGPLAPEWLYRLPSLVCSVIAGFLLIALLLLLDEGPHSRARAFGVAIFYALSYPLILYGSEARGYSLAICFLLAAAVCLCRLSRKPTALMAALTAIFTIAAFLSHYSMIQGLLTLFIFGFLDAARRLGWKLAVAWCSAASAPAVAVLAPLYFISIRHQAPGSGPTPSYIDAFVSAVSVAFGGPEVGAQQGGMLFGVIVWVLVLTAVLLIELALEARERSFDALFFALGVFLVPAAVIACLQPRVLMPRYVLFSVLLSQIVFVRFLVRMWMRKERGRFAARILCVLLGACVLCGTIWQVGRFLLHGRGTYSQALSYMLQHDQSARVTIGSDHDFRNGMVLEFLRSRNAAAQRVEYQASDALAGSMPSWYLIHSRDPFFAPAASINLSAVARFNLSASFPSAPLSGWTWHVYQRQSNLERNQP